MKTLCLNMIVKNESAIIERCLLSVKPFLSYWVIADTGSEDCTKEIIQRTLKDVPGELLEKSWVHFEHNRNEVLQASIGKGDYLLFIDADETLKTFCHSPFSDLEKDCYFIKAIGTASEFCKAFLAKNDGSWSWVGVLHEVIVSSQKEACYQFFDKGELLYDESSGYRSRNPFKFLDDAHVLEKALQENPGHPRYTFYLAQSYVHARKFDLALNCYEQRSQLGGDTEEIFWSLYCIGCLKEDMGFPSGEIIQAYCKAYAFKPTQAEPLYRLSQHLKNRPLLSELVINLAKKIPMPQGAARLQGWIYEKLSNLG